jgi:hypothetical protein
MKSASFFLLFVFMAVPADGVAAQIMSGIKQNLKTRVCTAEVLSYTDWHSCELEIPAGESPNRALCESRTALCLQGCVRREDPATCQLQCSGRGSICMASVR